MSSSLKAYELAYELACEMERRVQGDESVLAQLMAQAHGQDAAFALAQEDESQHEVLVHYQVPWACVYDDGEACGFQDDEFLNGQHELVSAFSHDGQPDVSHKRDVMSLKVHSTIK